ncbi:MAG: amino acid ABC transporter substrate-binding protein [Deltaproteobacteria bacterium]|nr:MAG: amino acid ABC transporter substrate-binding protein [Deltaproteobacteria bacterium]
MPRFWVLILAMPIMLLTASCTEKEPVRVGFLAALTGRYADLGLAGRNGALLAVEEVNRRGGLHGRKIELLVRDNGASADRAIKAVRDLGHAGIAVLIGPMLSQMATVIKPEIDRLRLVTIGPTIATEKLDGLDDWFLRIYPSTRQNAELFADRLVKHEGLRRLSVFIDETNAAYTQAFYQAFARAFTALGGELEQPVTYHSGSAVPFYRLAETINRQQAEGLLLLSGAMDSAMVLHQLRSRGYQKPAFATEWTGTEDLLSYGGSAVEDLTFYNTIDRNSSSPAYLNFVQNYRARFGQEPGFASVHAYDATLMALEGLNRSGPNPEQLKQALLNLGPFPGLQATLRMTPTGDIERPLFYIRVENGRFRTLR